MSAAFGSYVLFVLIFFLQDRKQPFRLKPDVALAQGSWLLFWTYPICLVTSLACGWIFMRFGRRTPLFIGLLLSVTGTLILPYLPHKLYPGLFLCLVLIQIGLTISSSSPLIPDYIKESSMSAAIAFQGFVTTLATVSSIAGLFYYTKHMSFQVSLPIAAAIFLVLGTIATLMLKP